MDDLETHRPPPDLAEAPQSRSSRQRVALRIREVEKSQREKSGAVGDLAEQGPLPTEHDLRELHFPFYCDPRAGNQRAEGDDLSAIFVTERQDEQQVLHLIDTQPLQLF